MGVCDGIVDIWVVLSLTIALVFDLIISSLDGFLKEFSVELQATQRQIYAIKHPL